MIKSGMLDIRKVFYAITLTAICSLAFSQPAFSSKITWYKPEFPPLSIVNGPDAGKGYSDKIEQYLMANLGLYTHEIMVSPFKRTIRDLKQGLKGCSVTLLKTPERDKFIAFSNPARLLLANSLIIRKSDATKYQPFLNADGKVSVEKIIQDGKFEWFINNFN